MPDWERKITKRYWTAIIVTASLKEDDRGGIYQTSACLFHQSATRHRAVDLHFFTLVLFRLRLSICLR
jgi:hypothetical protein